MARLTDAAHEVSARRGALPWVALASLGLGIAAFAVLPQLCTWTESPVLPWLGALCTAAGGYALVARRLGRDDAPILSWALLILIAVALRAVPWMATPWLSDDLYRYVWEGRVARGGFSPFAHAPDDVELTALRDDDVWPRVNHRDIPAIYPPGVQALFGANLWGVAGWRWFVGLGDLALLIGVAWLLRRTGRPRAHWALVAWHPLWILEFAGTAHLDLFALAAVMASLVALTSGRPIWAAVGGAVGTLCKPQAAAVFVTLLVRRRFAALAVGAACVAAAFIPYRADAATMLDGARHYAQHWEFNGLLHPGLRGVMTVVKDALEATPDEWPYSRDLLETGWELRSNESARRIATWLFLGAALAWSWRLRRKPIAATAAVLLAYLATSPTVHPWYVAWMVPFLPWMRSRALGLWTLTALASSWVKLDELTGGTWHEPWWLRAVQWGPACLWAAWELWSGRDGVLTEPDQPA